MAKTTSSKCAIDDCRKKVKGDARFCSRGCRNIGWIEENLFVPDGRLVGKKVVLLVFQRDALRGIYNTPTRTAILSFGRKNGKTGLSSMILLLHLCGPEARFNTEMNSSAMSRDQASILHRLAAKMVRLNPKLDADVVIRDTVKQLACPRLGTLYTALSADAATNFGLSPALIVHDELGQVIGPRHDLYDALETATGAHENPLSIIISTQAPTDADLLSILIDDGLKGQDPEIKVFLYTAPKDDAPFTKKTIKKANPAFGVFQNEKETLKTAASAKRMPSREAKYRNLILNQRVEASNPFVTQSVWRENEAEGDEWGIAFGGLDLSETNDLTAFVLVSPVGGIYNMEATFWLPGDGLEERSRQDRVPYDLWAKSGHLSTTPGRSVEYEYVAKHIVEQIEKRRIKKIAFDRWNIKHLKPWLIHAGMSEAEIDDIFVDFGQGFVSMGPALRNLESILLNGNLRHGAHPVMQMCAANAVVLTDPAGNRKLDKKKSRGRIDGMVSLAMAAAVANEESNNKPVYSTSAGDRIDEEDFLEDLE